MFSHSVSHELVGAWVTVKQHALVGVLLNVGIRVKFEKKCAIP